ncbi:nitroreductase [Bergeyella zoohelcum]|uniref:nitroreductase family protein n=1 Tax=Bergeyella zoohelcum TaxID=1015 RepID=UPI002A916A67|nr:nitroreductase [Bergeyella zoohelcum]MDY6025895.1 nitroreductase [Bergeyella zoohelcum]
MTIHEIIAQRRSIYPKDYIDKSIDNEHIETLLHAADLAPNHKKTKPWRFRVFKGEEKSQLALEMANAYKNSVAPEDFLEKKYQDIIHKIEQSGAIMTISIHFSGLVPAWEEIAATAMAVQNMYLTCTALEIGCYWSSPKFAENLHDFLQLEDSQKCYGLFYLGYYK